MVAFFSLSALLVFLLRLQYVILHIQEPSIHFFKTHLRMDGLLIGVLVSYYYHFSRKFNSVISKYSLSLIFMALIFILLPFIFSAGSFFMLTFGLTIMQAGFGIIVALTVVFSNKLDSYRFANFFVIKALSYIGGYSYSIYLWHLFLYKLLSEFWQKEPPVIIYFTVTIIGGICLSLIVEQVFLKIRDKYFPTHRRRFAA
jgi:peptidoglycan/LPS O-acetylase OafA/YrhL